MNECKCWYINTERISDQQYARNHELKLIRQPSFNYDMYIAALLIAEENMPDDYKYYTVNIPLFKYKAKIYDSPKVETIPCMAVIFIRVHDKIYLYDTRLI